MTENSLRILILEDSPTMRELYRSVLGGRPGTELVFASDGIEGLDRIAGEAELGLMVVDINMPRMDGLEFLRRARDDLHATIPSIVISTEGEAADRSAALEAGASAYLAKPWRPEQLLAEVERLTRPTAVE